MTPDAQALPELLHLSSTLQHVFLALLRLFVTLLCLFPTEPWRRCVTPIEALLLPPALCSAAVGMPIIAMLSSWQQRRIAASVCADADRRDGAATPAASMARRLLSHLGKITGSLHHASPCVVVALLLVPALGFAQAPQLADPGKLSWGTTPTFPPFEYTKNDKAVGFDVDHDAAA